MTESTSGTPGSTSPEPVSSRHTGVYLVLVIVAILAAAYWHLRSDTIFGCPPARSAREYISYCQAVGYGDFDHGAWWFNLEPQATRSASAAEMLIVGNSRASYAFSSQASQDWLAHNTQSYFLMGFAFWPQVLFDRAMLGKLNPKARMYIVNIDDFFEEKASEPARMVMEDPNAQSHYREKQVWQNLQQAVCSRIGGLCGSSYAIVRDRQTGVWNLIGTIRTHHDATFPNMNPDQEVVTRQTEIGRRFVEQLGVDRSCVIFTLVPTVNSPTATSSAIAAAIGVDFISPDVDDLLTFDGSHLDRQSSERWAAAFFEAAGPKIRQCLQGSGNTLTSTAHNSTDQAH